MTQYFQVGEEVIVAVPNQPQFDGPAIVLEAEAPHIVGWTSPHCGQHWLKATSQYSYWLDISAIDRVEGWSGYFAQSSLRKKPKPSDDAFESMMTAIKSGLITVKI